MASKPPSGASRLPEIWVLSTSSCRHQQHLCMQGFINRHWTTGIQLSSSSFLACNSRLRSAIRQHHPTQKAVLSQIFCFGERKVVLYNRALYNATQNPHPTKPFISACLYHTIPLWVGKNEYWLWLWPPMEKNGKSYVTVGPVTTTAGILAYSRLKSLAVNRAGHAADLSRMLAELGS